jgi:hypothetical protein
VCPCGLGQDSPRRVASYECHQYFLRTACPALHDSTAPLDAQAETTGRGVWITEDVSVLRIDHIPIKGKLLGVWQASCSRGVLDFEEINRGITPLSVWLRRLVLEVISCKSPECLWNLASGFHCSKAKASVIGCPPPIRIAQNGLEQGRNFIEKATPFLTWQRSAERISECVQPSAHSTWQQGGARNQLYTLRRKTGPPQP